VVELALGTETETHGLFNTETQTETLFHTTGQHAQGLQAAPADLIVMLVHETMTGPCSAHGPLVIDTQAESFRVEAA
jgi:hypothetical protein